MNRPYGYVIEQSFDFKSKDCTGIFPRTIKGTHTELYWNRKIYKTYEIAEEALKNIKKSMKSDKYTFDIIPLFKN
jgi:hypothetical protein